MGIWWSKSATHPYRVRDLSEIDRSLVIDPNPVRGDEVAIFCWIRISPSQQEVAVEVIDAEARQLYLFR